MKKKKKVTQISKAHKKVSKKKKPTKVSKKITIKKSAKKKYHKKTVSKKTTFQPIKESKNNSKIIQLKEKTTFTFCQTKKSIGYQITRNIQSSTISGSKKASQKHYQKNH